jgi:RNA polymerase sigma-70 factor (ECF subfamily)
MPKKLDNDAPCDHRLGSTSRSMLAAARRNDANAWQRLVTLYRPLITGLCLRGGVAQQDVADVLQEVMTAVAGNLERFRKERADHTFRGWLTTITRNKIHDYFRRRGHEQAAAGGTEAAQRMSQVADKLGGQDDDDSAAADFDAVILAALDAIRPEFHERTWQAFWLAVVEGKAAGNVAAELGMQPGGVRVAKSRVLARLRLELGDASPSDQVQVEHS